MNLKDIIGEHPTNSNIEKFNCGFIGCENKAIGVFEIKDRIDGSMCDVPLCAIHAEGEKI